MKKKILLFLLLFISGILFVKAKENIKIDAGYNINLTNDCMRNNECLLLCAYTNKVKYTADHVNPPGYDKYSSYIYYNFKNKTFYTEYITGYSYIGENKKKTYRKYYYALTKKYVFFEEEALNNLKNKGQCPSYSFIETHGVKPEVCFSTTSDFCRKKNNAGTKFKGKSTTEFNFQDHIKLYFDKWRPDILNQSCDKLRNKSIDIESSLITDFSKNYLHGNPIPNFIKNSDAYISGIKKMQEDVNYLLDKCNKEVDEKKEKGEISEEEANELKKQNSLGAQKIDEEIKKSVEEIDAGYNNDYDPTIDEQTCESLLGDPSPSDGAKKTPAYYLNFIFKVLRYIAIILLIVLSTMDFVTAVAAQDDDSIKKAFNKAIKRLILCVVIFVLPTLIEFILQFIHTKSIEICILEKGR